MTSVVLDWRLSFDQLSHLSVSLPQVVVRHSTARLHITDLAF